MKRKRELFLNLKILRAYAVLTVNTGCGGEYLDGHVVTTNGIVAVYSDDNVTQLRLAREGREYGITITPPLGRRGIISEAREFAARAVCGELPGGEA